MGGGGDRLMWNYGTSLPVLRFREKSGVVAVHFVSGRVMFSARFFFSIFRRIYVDNVLICVAMSQI